MQGNVLFYVACLVVMLCLLRSVLIVLGIYKNPVLRCFEEYGTEKLYSPMLGLSFWLFVSFILLLFAILDTDVVIVFSVAVFIPTLWFYQRLDEFVMRYRWILTVYPSWYYRLLNTTSREEQQRIAYMWLRLPLKTRLLYNMHDVLFLQWADLVLMSIV
jgi:hypothetical protein